MTWREALTKRKSWSQRAIIINLCHSSMLLKRNKWNMRSTAKLLGISLGMVSESRKLAEGLLKHPELEYLTRDKALEMLEGNAK